MKEIRILLGTDQLSAGYDGRAVISGLSCTVRSGEILALIGPNGAGKSTILKSVVGQLAPLAGTVYLEEKQLTEWKAEEKARRMAVLLTGHPAAELLTVRDVVSVGRYPYTGIMGILSERDRAVVEEAMALVGAAELAGSYFSGLSDGQKQRVLLARALCQEPDVLVLDEPTSFLDVRHKLELVSILKRLASEKGIAIVLSLHELEIAAALADRLICIRDGRPDRTGTPEEIFSGNYIAELYQVTEDRLNRLFREVYGDGSLLSRMSGNRDREINAGETGGRSGNISAAGTGGDRDISAAGIGDGRDVSGAAEPREEEHRVRREGKNLRCGYTTGTCAALASMGAAIRLLTGHWPETVSLITPKGWSVKTPLWETEFSGDRASCAVKKDAGDDVDCTDGILIFAEVSAVPSAVLSVSIAGGAGVGRVTQPGLDQPVGEAAINSVPREMIRNAVLSVCREADFTGDVRVVISVPGGEELAAKTMNPRLGIQGGISILGTSGIVEPMSRKALTDTIALELNQCAARGYSRVVLVPGHMGLRFLEKQGKGGTDVPAVLCSNYIGEALDAAAGAGFREVLLAGHIGKLVKLAGGIMNTHSREADCRRELFCTYAAVNGASPDLCRELMDCVTTDACLEVLSREGLRETVMGALMRAVQTHLEQRLPENCRTGAVTFSEQYGLLGVTEGAEKLLEEWKWYIS